MQLEKSQRLGLSHYPFEANDKSLNINGNSPSEPARVISALTRTPNRNDYDKILNDSMHIPIPHQNRSELNHLNSGGDNSLIEIPAGADFINQGSPVNKFGNGVDNFSYNINNSSGYSDQFTNI